MNPAIRISGLIRVVRLVREALSQPLREDQHSAWIAEINRTLHRVNAFLRKHGACVRDLPAPSRRAYAYLNKVRQSSLEPPSTVRASSAAPARPVRPRRRACAGNGFPWPTVGQGGAAGKDRPRPDDILETHSPIRFQGLRGTLEVFIEKIARDVVVSCDSMETLPTLKRTARSLEAHIARHQLTPARLTQSTRDLVGWFRYFARSENFARYHDAVRRSHAIFTRMTGRNPTWQQPILPRFIPMGQIFRWHIQAHGTCVAMPSPMISFGDELFEALGQHMCGDRRQRMIVIRGMVSPEYRRVADEILAAGGGEVEQTRGTTYDLAEIFEKVNRLYFAGQMPRPRLAWSRTHTHRAFGNYSYVNDRVTISLTLDSPGIPCLVLEYVMYHELLHRKLGLQSDGKRHHAHTPEFRALERQYPFLREADCFLRDLSRCLRLRRRRRTSSLRQPQAMVSTPVPRPGSSARAVGGG